MLLFLSSPPMTQCVCGQDGEPVRPGVAMTDLATGLYAHGAVMAALLQRHRTGSGAHIDCNLLSSQVRADTWSYLQNTAAQHKQNKMVLSDAWEESSLPKCSTLDLKCGLNRTSCKCCRNTVLCSGSAGRLHLWRCACHSIHDALCVWERESSKRLLIYPEKGGWTVWTERWDYGHPGLWSSDDTQGAFHLLFQNMLLVWQFCF